MIGIVTVVYNKLDFVQRTIEAVLEKTKPPFAYVIVYNQAPYPGVLEYLQTLPNVLLIENEENVGITRALKQGYEILKELNIDLMVKVDDDTVIETKWWNETFVEAFRLYPKLGILSSDIDSGKQVGESRVNEDNGYIIEHFANPCVGGGFTAYPMELLDRKSVV